MPMLHTYGQVVALAAPVGAAGPLGQEQRHSLENRTMKRLRLDCDGVMEENPDGEYVPFKEAETWRQRAIDLEMKLLKSARPSIGAVLQLRDSNFIPLPIIRLELRSDGAYDVIVRNATG
jgi:hypothetical protein